MRAAVIDIGSSSTKLAIGEQVGEQVRILETLRNFIEIGTNTFFKGRISQDIINQTIGILENYKTIIKQYEVSDVRVIATTAVREAENKDVFLDTVLRKTGFRIEVLNVGDIVYYIDAFLAYTLKDEYPIHERNVLIAELGAGSLDISMMEKGFTLVNLGIATGTLRLEQFKNSIEGTREEIYGALAEYVEQQVLSVKKANPNLKIDDIILIDESHASTLQALLPGKDRDSGFFKLKYLEVRQFVAKVTENNLDELGYKYHLSPAAMASIDVFAISILKLFKLLKNRHIFLFKTSLSQAILVNILFGIEMAKRYNKVNQLVSVAKFIGKKYNVDLRHNKFVADLTEQMFNQLKDTLGLRGEDRLYVILAAYLHNIGIFINNRSSHKHAEYIISSLNLFRLTDQEIKMIACIARYHRKSAPHKTHFLYNSLPEDAQILVQKLSSILRITNALDSSHKQKIKKLEVLTNQGEDIRLVVHTQDDFVLEKTSFMDKKELFEEISGSRIRLIVQHQE